VTRRLVATYLLLAAVVLVALEVPLGIVNQRGQRQDLERRVERDAVALAALSEDALQAGAEPGDPALARIATSYARDSGARVAIVDADGRLVADSDTTRPLGRSFTSRPEIAQALAGSVAVGTRGSRTLGGGLLFVAVPVASGGTLHGAVRVTLPTSSVDAQVRRYWLILVAIAFVVLAAVAIAGRALARWVARPLIDLRDTARRAGAGDLAVRADVHEGPPEVRELASEFDDMVARLERLVASQREFVADASHQLRSPLTALRLRLENLASHEPSPEEVEATIVEVDRLSRLVDGLIALAREDETAVERRPVDMGAVVAERALAWASLAEDAGVEIAVVAEPGAEVPLTPGALEQIVDNLVANAIEASPAGAAVTVRARRLADGVEVAVEDRGPGMDEETRRRAFDRFASFRESGTGLGLAIVKRLVEADGGTVALEPAAGGGLLARVRYPAASGEGGPAATSRSGASSGA
jgi:signal transduction histidine kinase